MPTAKNVKKETKPKKNQTEPNIIPQSPQQRPFSLDPSPPNSSISLASQDRKFVVPIPYKNFSSSES